MWLDPWAWVLKGLSPNHARSYKRQKQVYEGELRRAGMVRMHALRHGYAIRRYGDLAGWKARRPSAIRRGAI